MSETNQKTEKEIAARELSWPKLQWRATLYFTIVSVLLAIVLFVAPWLSEGRFDKNRILIAVIIIVIPFVVFTGIPWLYKAIRTIVKRVIYYPEIQRVYLDTKKDFMELHKAMTGYLMNEIGCHKLEIQLAAFKDGKIFLILLRKAEVDIKLGDVVEVIDSRDYQSMGQFRITEIRSEVYYAEEARHVDKLWLGYVKIHGETKFLPNMIALHIPRGENNEYNN
jgi:hypothetical protein